jgi:tetratricopeptide (TPR) repeat protein
MEGRMSAAKFPLGKCLSVAIVARNDEALVAETIRNVRDLADEIVVLDTDPAGRTSQLAEDLGARAVRFSWQNDGSAARNHLFARLTGHWILWLEPGERIDADSAAQLRQFVDREVDWDAAYAILVQSRPAASATSTEQVALVRLMPNRPELRFEGRVRETARPSILAAGLKIGIAPGGILRHPRCLETAWKSMHAWQQLDLASLETTSSGASNVRVLLAMGEAASDLEDHALARQAFAEVVRIAPRGSLEMLEGYYGLLASFDGESGDAQRQIAVSVEALEIYPLDTQLLCALGNYLLSQNQRRLAIRAFDSAVKYGTVNVETCHLVDVDQAAVAYLSLTLQLDGQDELARQVLEEGRQRFPQSMRLGRQLLELHIRSGRCDDAIRTSDEMPCDPAQRDALRDAIQGACLAAQQRWIPALAHLQAAFVAGCDDPICLRWLSMVLISAGQAAAAEPILRRWRDIEPDNTEIEVYLKALTQESAAAGAPEDSHSPMHPSERWRRVDAATSLLDVISPHIPMISQILSTD